MAELSTPAWIALAAIAGIGLLAMLNAAATVIRNQTHVHDTRVRVNTLRKDYIRRIQDADEVEVVDEAGPEPAARAPGSRAA